MQRFVHGFLLLPRCSLLALGGALDALDAANAELGHVQHSSLCLSLDGRPVRCSTGTRVQVDHGLADAPELQSLFILADLPLPDAARDGHGRQLHPWLQERARFGMLLGGIGSGAAVLAQAGLLDGHRATLAWAQVPQLADSHPAVLWSSRVYEIDRQRLSCGAGTASLDLLIAWLGRLHGDRLAQALVGHFGLDRLRGADERQPSPVQARIGTGGAKLAEAVALMEANLGEPLPTEDIARLAGVSRRQLERLFKQHLDALPSRYYAELRLMRARRLLQQTGQSILQIGLACGFASGSHFSSAYRSRFGHTPREARSQRAVAWRDEPDQTISPDPAATGRGAD